jgi:hypothetical protein
MTRICGFLLINHIDGYMMLYANPFFTKPQNYIYIIRYIISKYQIVADISHYISLCPFISPMIVGYSPMFVG